MFNFYRMGCGFASLAHWFIRLPGGPEITLGDLFEDSGLTTADVERWLDGA